MRANVTPLSPLLTDNDSSAFLPVAPHAVSDFVYDGRVIAPTQGSTLGDTLRWEFTKNAAVITGFTLRMRQPAFPVPVGGSFLRCNDWMGIAVIKEVRMIYYSNLIYKFDKDYLYQRVRDTSDPYKLEMYQNTMMGDKTSAQRSQATQAGFVTHTNLMFPFSFDTTQSMPIVCLAQKLQIEIDTELIDAVYDTDLPSTTGLTNPGILFDMYVDYMQLTEPETVFLVNKAQSPDGIAYLNSNKINRQVTSIQIPANSATQIQQEIKMLNRGCVKETKVMFIPQQLRTTNHGNDWFVTSNNPQPIPAPAGVPAMGAYGEIVGFSAQANGVELFRAQLTNNGINWLKNSWFKKFHTGRPGENIYRMVYSLAPEQENASLGYAAYANFDNPTLFLTFNSNGVLPGGTGTNPLNATNQILLCIILYYTYTYIQVQGGDIVEAFV